MNTYILYILEGANAAVLLYALRAFYLRRRALARVKRRVLAVVNAAVSGKN